jgi:hypothetical protein
VLPLLAATLHVPALHAALLEQAGLLQPPTTPAAIKACTPCTPSFEHLFLSKLAQTCLIASLQLHRSYLRMHDSR